MQKTRFTKFLSLIVCIVLIAALALFATGCNDTTSTPDSSTTPEIGNVSTNDGSTVLGEGETQFAFVVVDGEGKETKFEIHTDKTTVGEALLDLNLIAGEESEFGLYVKTVNGITADYDTDGTYWGFYIDGEYASTGVDSTEITAGAIYTLKVETA